MRKKETHGDFYQVPDDLTLTEATDILNRHLVVADSTKGAHFSMDPSLISERVSRR